MAAAGDQKFSSEKNLSSHRIVWLSAAVFLFGIIIIGKLFAIQVLKNSFYSNLATKRQEVSKDLLAKRGSIYVRNNGELFPLVTNIEYFQLYAEPVKVTDKSKVVDSLTPILNLAEPEWKEILGRLNKVNDPYEPIKNKVTKQQKEQIEKLKLAGLGFAPETFRYYPEAGLGGHMLGFVRLENQYPVGHYGLEGYFNELLAGKSGFSKSVKDASGAPVAIGPRVVQPAEDGSDLVLTIDRNIQFTACQKLKQFYDYFKAEDGTVIIMEPTGAILAMCSFPDFEPEKFNETKNINDFNNPAIFAPYEPGSVFKAMTMAAGLNLNKIQPDTTYVDAGEVKVGPYTIRNADLKAHGEQTMVYVLEQSLNTGAMFVEDQIGNDEFSNYVKAFGFGQKTGIELDSEIPGDISSLDKSGDVFHLTASFGQGITATPIELVTAYAALANQGQLPKPYIVSEIIKPDGVTIKTKPEVVRKVVEPRAASLLTGMLTSVVEKGYDHKARVPGYYLAGKTGTAQIASGGKYSNQTNHTFIGYGPISHPQFVILIKLAKPQGIRFASDSISPLFRQLSEFLLNYYKIQPDYQVSQ